MAVNDLVTVGATPLSVHAYWAAGGSDWFAERARARPRRRLEGGVRPCGVTWGGGETPALAGVVAAGAHRSRGVVRRHRASGARLTLGERLGARRRDRAARVERHPRERHHRSRASSPSACRTVTRTTLADGALFGEALLAPTRSTRRSPRRSPPPASSRTTRQHHRPRLAQADASSRRVHLPHPHAPAGPRCCSSCSSRPASTTARPTAT